MNTIVNVTTPVEFIKTVAATGTPENFTRRSGAGVERITSGTYGICFLSFPSPLGYIPGARITITGANEAEFNVTDALVVKVGADGTDLLFQCPGTTLVATGTLISTAKIGFRKATVMGKKAARTANAGTVYFNQSATNDTQSFAVTTDGEAQIGDANGPLLNLGDYYLDVATAGDGLIVRYY